MVPVMRRSRPASDRQSRWHGDRRPKDGSCRRRRALPACGSIAVVVEKPETSLARSTDGSPRASILLICRRPRRCSTRCVEALLHQEHALAGGLGVEQVIGLIRLVELPLMCEQAVDIDLALDAETRAIGLPLPREGPGGNDRQLLTQHVGADIDRHIVALADKAYRAPHLSAAYGGDTALGLARSVEGEVGAAVGQVLDRANRVVGGGVDRL